MRSDRDTARIVRSWLEEGVTQLPDRVLDAVLDEVPSTSQRRTWWRVPWSRATNTTMAVVLAGAAVVVAVTLIGSSLLRADRVGGPETDGASPSPASQTLKLPSFLTPVQPGRYSVRDAFPADVTFEVPDGWDACVYSDFEQGVCSPNEDAGGVGILAVDNVVIHPCDTRLHDPPAGRSMDAFLSAVADLSGFTVTEPVEVTRGDLVGRQVTVAAPVDPPCQALRTWSVPGRTNGVHAGEVNVVEVFDVGGRLVAVVGAYREGVLTAEEIAEIRAIMASVEIRP